MKNSTFKQSTVAAVGLLLGIASSSQAAILFQDSFTNFTLGGQWEGYGAGAPDIVLGLVGVGADGSSLRMGTLPGAGGEVLGIQTTTSFPIAGVRSVRVTARLRPLNETTSGDGGASDASAGVAIVSSTGAFVQASAGANRATSPDWGDFYADSEGSANASSIAYLHYAPNDPAPGNGAEAFRTFVLEITTNGTSLTTLSITGQPLANTPFNVFNPNLTLAAFSNTVNIALFQQRSDSTL
ncbi:MAG: hypothetical protein NT154_06840, partial [Verrucomicrobia bacterium]|nr:hypothetical protein [Verrucomicrobiota bacterium]